MNTVATGLEECLRSLPEVLCGARVGLLSNQAAIDRRFLTARELLAKALGPRLVALFAPQHGFFSEQQDNMVETAHAIDPELKVPVHSLYSDTRQPTRQMLEGVEVLVVDLQDVGCRVYTFLSTLSYCLESCSELGIPVVVLDRPNPLGGVRIEGHLLDSRFASFVGRASIPMRHDLTIGEMAIFLNEEIGARADLTVVPMRGWSRSMLFNETGLPWTAPSPNLPRLEGVLVYPGQVMLEGTTLSEGRGTTMPFEICGAPFIDPYRLRIEIEPYELKGVVLRPVRFEPTSNKWQGRSCGGLCLHLTSPETFEPYRTTLALLVACKRLWPRELQWKEPPYEYEMVRPPIDMITGGSDVRSLVDGAPEMNLGDLRTEVDRLCFVDANLWRTRTTHARRYQ